jgi:3-methylcrotonyl-CoA carboxylase beta subunit
MVAAVSCARVPKLTVVVGGSYGAGNYGMCGRAYDPRFLWMWPNARISVMGGEQAATVLTSVASDRDPQQIEALRARIRAQYDAQGHPYHATARLWDDGVIDPLTTRDVVGRALSACANAPLGEVRRPVFRM